MPVQVDRDGPLFVVTLDRPEVKNAVDRPTAEALAAAFREFEADPAARVLVLTGAGGTFSAGADLKAVASGRPNRVEPTGDGPMGPTRMVTTKPTIAAIAGHWVRGALGRAHQCELRYGEHSKERVGLRG
ncbi:MAG: enoyl-CoA hydratase/isomerase family protein, partial [Myxococcales bacterium]|nr:enoyl-CoA hydratase/isomerase family protein [Myxococcales bacterium]